MCARLAVSNDLFLEWIADEEAQPDALSDELVLKNIIDLFRMAVHERVSLIMWQRYVDFAAGLAHSHDEDVKKAASAAFDGPDYLFSVLQQAVNATSAHYLQSQALWPQYCDYIALEIKRAEGSHRDKLVDQLRNVFFERLAQPHAGLEDTFAMYSEFTTRYNEAEYEQRMIEANKVASDTRTRCTQRNAFEDDLVASNGSWSDYARYIDKLVQDNANSPKEVCMLYERALVLNCYSPEVWHDYIVYLDSLSRDKQSALEVARRAIRNCPWSGKLWAQVVYLAFLHAGYAQATQDFTQAVDTHAVDYSMVEFGHVAVAWLAVTRADTDTDSKALLAACAKCVDIAYSLDVSTADPLLFFERCCTSTVAGVVTDTEYARKLWTRICKARKSCTEAWVLSAEFERMHGSDTATRSVFRHAAQRRLDNPERLFDA
ncbi:Splicing factor, partial [Coemansia sp. Cherry 401B]